TPPAAAPRPLRDPYRRRARPAGGHPGAPSRARARRGLRTLHLPLLAHCRSVLAVDLSRRVLGALAAARDARGIAADHCPTLYADLDPLRPDAAGAAPDFVVGIFFLHHLVDFRRTLVWLSATVAPGGVAFVEPTAAPRSSCFRSRAVPACDGARSAGCIGSVN